jgi:hypothetical protein
LRPGPRRGSGLSHAVCAPLAGPDPWCFAAF